ncbi:MAG TPA: hypothetical protein VMR62_18005 [Bryobacteraceae bacterium]|nr:hypothetical protein [Bryobacteraceae bacterium]
MGLDAEEDEDILGLAQEAAEAFPQDKVAVLFPEDVDVLDHFEIHQAERAAVGIEGLIQARGVHAGFGAGTAVEGLLGERETIDGPELLGVDGLVALDEVGAAVGDFFDIFEAEDGEVGGVEEVFARVLGSAGLDFGGTRSGGVGGVGSVGSEALGGDGWFCHWFLASKIAFRQGRAWGLGRDLVGDKGNRV